MHRFTVNFSLFMASTSKLFNEYKIHMSKHLYLLKNNIAPCATTTLLKRFMRKAIVSTTYVAAITSTFFVSALFSYQELFIFYIKLKMKNLR